MGDLDLVAGHQLKTRDVTIDIIRGMLIILVVLGHSGISISKYIYWFHMPLFFFISGIFFKKINTIEDFKNNIIKLTWTLIVPYFSYLILINFYKITTYIQIGDMSALMKFVMTLLYGGRRLGFENGVFWFITVLYFTRILTAFLSIYFTDKIIFYIVSLLFCLGIFESAVFNYLNKSIAVPFNTDVVLIAAFFYYSGYLLKSILTKIDILAGIVAVALITIVII